MRTPRIFRTASFKLAALYALIFGASVVVLGTFVYFTATTALNQATRTRISADASLLQVQFQRGGLDRMIGAIRERQRGRLVGGLDYTVFDANGHRLFGNLPSEPRRAGWQRMKGPPDGDEPRGHLETLIVLFTPLGDGHWLLIGDDVGRIRDLGRAILQTFSWVFALVLTLAILGGAALSFAFLRRIDSITRTVEAIIRGDIRRRIPLRGTEDDMDRLAGALNQMLDRITSLMDALRQVSSDIAHDLRTPLGRLRQRLDDVRHSASTLDDYKSAVDRAVLETDAILETFAALLRIAQIEAGTRRSAFKSLDLSDLVSNIGQTYVPVAEDAGKRLEISVDPGIILEGDRELLVQMLVNLIENAITHTQTNAVVTVGLKSFAARPTLSVSDNGPGIPVGERARVFERFYRLESSRTTTGSGLGLSLVAAIAELHDAEISIEDNRPGLLLTVRFPNSNAASLVTATDGFASTIAAGTPMAAAK